MFKPRGVEGGLENQDKLGHRGGGGFSAIRMSGNLKKFKNKLLFLYFEHLILSNSFLR
jgi:hypothetical protein